MKKIIITLILSVLVLSITNQTSQASFVSNKKYRTEIQKEQKQDIKQVNELFNLQTKLANQHNLEQLATLYAENYINNDGYDKKVYLKSIETTWKSCPDLTYKTKITSIDIAGDHADIYTDEVATGTLIDNYETFKIYGEIHSKSKGIYHLEKTNGKWIIAGESSLSEESYLVYGDARFMNIELQAPSQINSGDTYTASLKVDADEKTFVMASINSDPVVYPTKTADNNFRILPQSNLLERVIKANSDNLNEYVVVSMAISKLRPVDIDNYKMYMAGLACLMKRVNVVPKNNFIKLEE